MKIYCAASSRELDRVERVQSALRAAGFTITRDWCADIRANGITDESLSDAQAICVAMTDLIGVRNAELLIFLAPTETSKMAWGEYLVAIERGTPCIVAHDDEAKRRQSICLALADAHCDDAGVVDAELRLAGFA